MYVGHWKFRGVGLGAAAVLFLAIGLSAWAVSYDGVGGAKLATGLKLPTEFSHLGLAIFAFAIGLNSGRAFFESIKKSLAPILATIAILSVAASACALAGWVMGLSSAEIGGVFAGATTNTPALAAAGEAAGNEELATVGYSISYLFGVIGMIIAAQLALGYGKSDKDTPVALASRTIRVERADQPTVGEIERQHQGKITFSRIRHLNDGSVSRPKADEVLERGSYVTVVGPKNQVIDVVNELGRSTDDTLTSDRRQLDFRRITISNPKLSGLTVADLHMADRFQATISRVRRGDTDMFAEDKLVLQLGDRVRVVGPASKMEGITKFFGDSASGFSNINPIAFGLGMAIGMFIGHIPIPLGGGQSFSIGAAAGTLIVGLIFGRIGRIGTFPTTLPFSAAQVLAELGLLIFLAQAGSNAGTQIAKAFTGGVWYKYLALGMLVTTIVALGLYLVMRFIFHMGGTRLSGYLGGTQTQPAVLGFANGRTNMDPRVALGYSMIYPAAMVGKIILGQILGSLPL